MGGLKFLALSTLGSVLWVGSFLALGALLSEQIDRLLPAITRFASITLAVILVLLALYVAFKWWERRRFFEKLRMARISVDELYQLMNVGAAVPHIVDVRTPSALTLIPKRIPGAIHLPHHQISEHVKELERDREVVLYCTCPNEASAAQVAKLLIDHGFFRVRPLHGGLEAWIAAGYPVELVPDVGTDALHGR